MSNGSASENVKHGLLVKERDPTEIHQPLISGEYNFAPNPDWIRILEFYCPQCGLQVETEYLPPGHPITNTTEIDLISLKRRLSSGELLLEEGHLRLSEGKT
jgi:acetone carboxylase, gamma subunit